MSKNILTTEEKELLMEAIKIATELLNDFDSKAKQQIEILINKLFVHRNEHGEEITLERKIAQACEEIVDNLQPDPKIPWPAPTREQHDHPIFESIWRCIKKWDINVPDAYDGYCEATGNHVVAIMKALHDDGFLIIHKDGLDREVADFTNLVGVEIGHARKNLEGYYNGLVVMEKDR